MNAEHSNAITISAGHNEPCHLCGELCDGLAGNPGGWPIMLPVDGAQKWHHAGCVAAQLAYLAKVNETRLERARRQAERIGELHAVLREAQIYIRNLPSQPQAAFKSIDARIAAILAPRGEEP